MCLTWKETHVQQLGGGDAKEEGERIKNGKRRGTSDMPGSVLKHDRVGEN